MFETKENFGVTSTRKKCACKSSQTSNDCRVWKRPNPILKSHNYFNRERFVETTPVGSRKDLSLVTLVIRQAIQFILLRRVENVQIVKSRANGRLLVRALQTKLDY